MDDILAKVQDVFASAEEALKPVGETLSEALAPVGEALAPVGEFLAPARAYLDEHEPARIALIAVAALIVLRLLRRLLRRGKRGKPPKLPYMRRYADKLGHPLNRQEEERERKEAKQRKADIKNYAREINGFLADPLIQQAADALEAKLREWIEASRSTPEMFVERREVHIGMPFDRKASSSMYPKLSVGSTVQYVDSYAMHRKKHEAWDYTIEKLYPTRAGMLYALWCLLDVKLREDPQVNPKHYELIHHTNGLDMVIINRDDPIHVLTET